jgi:hypothetical protein
MRANSIIESIVADQCGPRVAYLVVSQTMTIRKEKGRRRQEKGRRAEHIHLRPSQRQRTPHGAPQHRIPRQRTRRINPIRMHQIIRRIDKHTAVSRPKRNPRNQRRNPVDVGRAGPRKDHLADRNAHGGDAHDADHGLRVGFPSRGILRVRVDHAAQQRFGENGDYAADADAQIREACEARRPAAELAEDDRVRDEAAEGVVLARGVGGGKGKDVQVQNAVYEGDVYVPEDANGL